MKRMLALLLVLAGLGLGSARAAVDLQNAPEKLGWQLGTQAYTFKDLTFTEAVERAKTLGVKYIEFFPGQKFSKDQNFAVSADTTPEQRTAIKKLLADAGIKAVSYGVVGGLKDEAGMEKVFAFAKDMGLLCVNCEPADNEATAKLLARVAEKYGVKAALHNHPKPSTYWSPETVLQFVDWSGAPNLVGSCCDTGHFVRSGLDPLECINKLGGHIVFFHFKDLNAKAAPGQAGKKKKGGEALHDVPWGTGVNNVWAAMNLMKEQKFHGPVLAEYEYWTSDQMANLQQSFDFFRMASAALDDEGWEPLFKSDLSNAQMLPGGWTFENGVLEVKKGDLWTREQYGNFILDLEFRNAADTNSGVFLRCTDPAKWLNSSIEIQILQKPEKNTTHNTGAVYDVKGVASNDVKPVGEWNHMTIIAKDNLIYVMLNGNAVNWIDLDKWTTAGKNPDGTKNKFKNAYKDMGRKGVLGLQYHGKQVSFRNVKVKSLD